MSTCRSVWPIRSAIPAVGFAVGEDRIAWEKSVFKSLAEIDYDAATGALTFDPGAPGGERIEFARLARNLAISDGDFVLV